LLSDERRFTAYPDRRRVPRGGRRKYDRPGRSPMVLVADSYEDARSPIVRYLDRCGFDVIEAASAQEAAEVIESRQPQAVLSGLHGLEASRFYEILAERVANPRIVIVMLSSGDESIPTQATGVLTKPFSLRPMLDELRRQLRVHAAERAVGGL
jgi:DNA-binding response OmpR family regulator